MKWHKRLLRQVRSKRQFCVIACDSAAVTIGRAYYLKGHVPLDAFMAAMRMEVTDDDTILKEEPEHCWLRVCRDFEEWHQIIVEAKPESKGAFRATWIQDA